MAENNQTETSNDGASTQQETEHNQDAQLLDDLTVLARDDSGQDATPGETLGGASDGVDDGGYENLQSDVRLVDDNRVGLQVEGGPIGENGSNTNPSVGSGVNGQQN